MSEFQRRHLLYKSRRPPIAEQVVKPVVVVPGIAPKATIEQPAGELANSRKAIGLTLEQVTQRDPTRRALRFRNAGATNLAVGGSGVTLETAVVLLAPGDIWDEQTVTGAAWWAVSSAAGGALVIEEGR